MTKINNSIFPILITERLTLKPLSIDDHQDVFDLRSDPEVNKYLDRQLCKTTEDARNFIYKINENIANGGTYYWAIIKTDTKQLVGTICLFDFSSKKKSCEIGFELMKKFRGQGIMQEAVQTVIDFVFQTLKLKKILAYTHCENQNAINLLLKFNFIKSIETKTNNSNLTVFTVTH